MRFAHGTTYNRGMARETTAVKEGVSFEEFLEFERTSQVKHEFVDGRLFLMPGVTDRHNKIAGNIYVAARLAIRDTDCDVYFSDVLVRTPNNIGYYPDVFGTCDQDDTEPRVKRLPCFIIEVLSQTTEAIDRGEKLLNYSKISSLQTYVLVTQDEPRAEVFSRQNDGSWRYEVIESGGTLKLPCINLEMPLKDVYTGVL